MTMTNVVERPATSADAVVMTRIVDMAGEGLPFHLWGKMAADGQDPWEVGRIRAQRESGGFSYRNATLLERDGQVVAGMIGYTLPDEPAPLDLSGVPPMFAPLEELEQLAPGTWYVNVLAVLPDARRQGHGRRLLKVADDKARAHAKRGTSLIVSDANEPARRLYESCGYRDIARRPMVKEDWVNPGRNWVLLVKMVAGPEPLVG